MTNESSEFKFLRLRGFLCGALVAGGLSFAASAAEVESLREWIGANGTGTNATTGAENSGQCIVLDDCNPTAKARVVLTAAMMEVDRVQGIFSCRSGSGAEWTTNTFSFFYVTNVNTIGLRFDYNVTAQRFSGPQLSAGQVFSADVSGLRLDVDGVEQTASGYEDFQPGAGNAPLVLFASSRYRGGEVRDVSNFANMRLYSLKVYDTVGDVDGVLVKDLHPCVDTDGECGLYDSVTGRIYYKDLTTSTGAFSVSDVEVDLDGDPYPAYIDTADAEMKSKYAAWKDVYGADGEGVHATAFLLNLSPDAEDQSLRATSITCRGETVVITANLDLGEVNGRVYVKSSTSLPDLATAHWTEATLDEADAIQVTRGGADTAGFYKIKVDFKGDEP